MKPHTAQHRGLLKKKNQSGSAGKAGQSKKFKVLDKKKKGEIKRPNVNLLVLRLYAQI